MNNCFLITTYGRKKSCQRLVNALQGLGDIYVLNDGDDYEIKNCYFYSNPYNLGKPLYWHTVNNLWGLPTRNYDYYFMIPDDFFPVKGFVERSIKVWESIKDEDKICMNLYRDKIPRETCWTGVKPISYNTYRKTQWVDMCFLAEKRFFKEIGYIPKIVFNWKENPYRSTGVGSYISKTLHKKGLSLYQIKETQFKATKEHETSQLGNNPNSKPTGKGINVKGDSQEFTGSGKLICSIE